MVQAALARGLQVIVVLHHFKEIMDDPAGQAETFAYIWAELSAHWQGAPDGLIFELLNEPHGALTTEGAVGLFGDVFQGIRARHPDRWLVLEGGDWARWTELTALPRFDDRLIHSFHYYDPYEVTHQLAPWAASPPLPARAWRAAEGAAAITRDLEAAAQATRAPILLGEFGVYRGADPATRTAWTGHVRHEAERLGMGWCVWGFAADFRIFDAGANAFLPDMLDALMTP
jgi:endoglucanase